jgi:hypothetical protein
MYLRFIVFLVSATLFASSCASWQQTKWLNEHRSNLKKIAASNASPEEKADALIRDYVQFMNEGLQFADPAKGAKYVKKYHDQNNSTIQQIVRETTNWQKNLNTTDKVALGIRTAQKTYVKDLIDLGPKFKRKYKQYAFIVKMTDDVVGIPNILK